MVKAAKKKIATLWRDLGYPTFDCVELLDSFREGARQIIRANSSSAPLQRFVGESGQASKSLSALKGLIGHLRALESI